MLPLKTFDSTNLKYLTGHFLCEFFTDIDSVLIWNITQVPYIDVFNFFLCCENVFNQLIVYIGAVLLPPAYGLYC